MAAAQEQEYTTDPTILNPAKPSDELRQLAEAFAVEPLPDHEDPVAQARAQLTDHDLHGRTAEAWIDWARQPGADASASEGPAATSLDDAISRLYEALPATGPAPAASAALPAELAQPLASLVAALADVSSAQAAMAEDLEHRWTRDHDLASLAPTDAERAAMVERTELLVQALERFESQAAASHAAGGSATCVDPPECLVYVGSPGSDTYERSGAVPDPVLVVEPGGDDTYRVSAGGANPTDVIVPGNRVPVSVVLDQGGDDNYTYGGEPAAVQGAGTLGGIGVLVDRAGDDNYSAELIRNETLPFTQQPTDAGAHGHGTAGVGVLLDDAGDDRFRLAAGSPKGWCVSAMGQGFGSLQGVGVMRDAGGSDRVVAESVDHADGPCGPGSPSGGLMGMYVQGATTFGGVGVLAGLGAGGDDYHALQDAPHPDYYAQGYGLAGGAGILYDEAGDDSYVAHQETHTSTVFDSILNCAFGSAQLGGVGIQVDLGGSDSYLTESITSLSGVEAHAMSEGWADSGHGLFVDYGGDDERVMRAEGDPGMVSGRGERTTHNAGGTYLDVGGQDTYVGPPTSWTNLDAETSDPNDAVWPTGADLPRGQVVSPLGTGG